MEIDGLTARATSFIHRLRLHPQIYRQFQRVMKDYSTDKLNIAAVVSELDALFQFHSDLLAEYRIFLSPQLQATLPPHPRQPRKKKCVTKSQLKFLKPCIIFMNKVQKRFADERVVIAEYLDTVRALTQAKLDNKEAYYAILKIFGKENQDLVDGFEWLLLGGKGIKKKNKKEEKMKNSPSPSNSNSKSNSGDEIKAGKQISNQMEDEMFELDINLSHRKTTVDSANMLMDSLEENQHQIINIDNYFSAVSLGYIKKVYKKEGSSIITRLRDDPRSVLPEILEKLESEEEVLIKKWRDIHEKKKNPVTKSSGEIKEYSIGVS